MSATLGENTVETPQVGEAVPGAGSKRLASNFILSGISEVSMALLFLLLILSARWLGDEQFGVFSFVLAYTGIFTFLIDGGFRHVYVRSVARDPSLAASYLGNMLALQLLYGAAAFVLMILLIEQTDKSAATRTAVQLMALAEVLRGIKYLFRYVLRTSDRYDLEAVTMLFERVLLFVAGIGVLLAGGGIIALAGVFVGVRLLDLVLVFFLANRVALRPTLKFQADLWYDFTRQAFPFMLNGAVALMLFKIDSVLLSLLRTDAEVGWYNAAYRIVDGTFIVALMTSATFYPSFARAQDDIQVGQRLLGRALRYIFLLALPIALIGAVTAGDFMPLLYGAEYDHAIVAFQILAWGLPFLFLHEVMVVFLGAINRQRVALASAFVALVVNILLNLLLLPNYGFIGAGLATIAAEALLVVVAGLYLHRRGYHIPYLKLLSKPLLAAAIIAIVLHFWIDNLMLTCFLAIAGYFGLLTVLRFWDEKERHLFQGTFARIAFSRTGLGPPKL